MDSDSIDGHPTNPNSGPQPLQPLGFGSVRLTPNYWYSGLDVQSHQQIYQHPLRYWHHPNSLPNQPISPQEAFHGQSMPASPAVPEHKKHKRTRSGCYTCRARRVKVNPTWSLTLPCSPLTVTPQSVMRNVLPVIVRLAHPTPRRYPVFSVNFTPVRTIE